MANEQSSIGAAWLDMGQRSEIPTRADREAHAAAMRRGISPVRYAVLMRFERIFDTWSVTLIYQGTILRECRFQDDSKIEQLVERGRGFTCLADRQAVEAGIRQGLGMVKLSLDEEQFAALEHPR